MGVVQSLFELDKNVLFTEDVMWIKTWTERKGEEGPTTWPTLPGCFMARPPLDTAAATFPSRSTTTAPTVSRHPEPFSYITVRRGVTLTEKNKYIYANGHFHMSCC